MNRPSATFDFTQLSDLDSVASELLLFAGEINVWMFNGQMGAGKTTLIKSLCKQLGVRSVVQSPTFALVNEYSGSGGETICHFDFYRIKDETEALDMGIEEYFDSGDYCFVEWPEKIESLWPEQFIQLDLYLDENNVRTLRAIKNVIPTN
jgi:tRNA threonylcarbamoyladenosine biosynthesis protein TsaE